MLRAMRPRKGRWASAAIRSSRENIRGTVAPARPRLSSSGSSLHALHDRGTAMKIVTVVGARPQFIKSAPVSRALKRADIREIVVHTGQHYDASMSETFFDQLELAKPHHHLSVGSGPHGQQTGRMLAAIEPVLQSEAPDWLLVYGCLLYTSDA